MKEPLENIQSICSECGDKICNEWQEKNKDFKIEPGIYVKVHYKGKDKSENFWVWVTKVEGDMITGRISNDLINFHMPYGSIFEFNRNIIMETLT